MPKRLRREERHDNLGNLLPEGLKYLAKENRYRVETTRNYKRSGKSFAFSKFDSQQDAFEAALKHLQDERASDPRKRKPKKKRRTTHWCTALGCELPRCVFYDARRGCFI